MGGEHGSQIVSSVLSAGAGPGARWVRPVIEDGIPFGEGRGNAIASKDQVELMGLFVVDDGDAQAAGAAMAVWLGRVSDGGVG